MAGNPLGAWGGNTHGQLGIGTASDTSSPTQVGTLSTWTTVASGGGSGDDTGHTLALKTDSTLWAWGINTNFNGATGVGQLGDNTTVNKSSPVQVGTLATWANTVTGYNHSLASKTDSTLWAWGSNGNTTAGGELGDGTTASKSSPIQVGTLANWATGAFAQAASYHNSFSIKTDSTLWAWGYNHFGQLGNNTTTNTSSPIQVGTLPNWSKVYVNVNSNHVVAIKTDSTLWAWGLGTSGELGNNTAASTSSPIQVGTIAAWTMAGSGVDHSVGLRSDSTIWAWGDAANGRVGDGTTVNKSSPVQIGTLATWNAISAGAAHTVATKTDQTIWAWGLNNKGALGDSTSVNKSSPVQVGTLATWGLGDAGGSDTLAFQIPALNPVVTNTGGFFFFF